MRIVPVDGRDYYDKIQAYGQDQTLVYVRKKQIIALHNDKDLASHFRSWPGGKETSFRWGRNQPKYDWEVIPYVIGFCGEIYPVRKITCTLGPQFPGYQPTKVGFAYDVAGMGALLEKFRMKDELKEFRTSGVRKRGYGKRFYWSRPFFSTARLAPFFEEQDFKMFKPFFTQYKVPVWVMNISDGELTVNPILNDFEFYRIKDAWQANQEISMYLGGVLGREAPEMVEISDKVMQAKKGFTHKYSFKKEPTKKRK